MLKTFTNQNELSQFFKEYNYVKLAVPSNELMYLEIDEYQILNLIEEYPVKLNVSTFKWLNATKTFKILYIDKILIKK